MKCESIMRPKVSVALATYNGEKYIEEQLESIIKQTRAPDELVICDDCSNDETINIITKKIKNAHFDVKLVSNDKNIGYVQNFSKALEMSSGDIVFLCDQDDVWLSDKIEFIINKFNTQPDIQLLIHDVDYCKEDLTPIGQTKLQRMESNFDIESDYVVGMATAVRRSFLVHCLPVPSAPEVTHDKWLHDCARVLGCKGIVREVLALYRRHSLNVTAPSRLNVDFVTTRHYFGNESLAFLKLFRMETDLGSPDISPLVQWLDSRKMVLLDNGFSSEDRINTFIQYEEKRLRARNSRQSILRLDRWKRLFPIYDLYRSGGYHYYCGWKSALKDLLRTYA